MATATYPALSFPGSARIRIEQNLAGGIQATGAAAAQDIGTGTWTIGRQMTATLLDFPLEKVDFQLGNSDLPASSGSSGSSLTASLARALADAASALREECFRIAQTIEGQPLIGLSLDDVVFRAERLTAVGDPSRSVSLENLFRKSRRSSIEGLSAQPRATNIVNIKQLASSQEDYERNASKFAFHSFGAHFVQVIIDEPIPLVRVERVISVMDVGRIVIPKTARSQIIGGVVMGLGAALMEETLYDPLTGRITTSNLADYPVCVNLDVQMIDVYFVDEGDVHFNSLGCRGVGEIGIVGVAAAVSNAVFHATGKRIRNLPLTPDKLL